MSLVHPEALSRLKNLRRLNLARTSGLTTVPFLKDLSRLQVLDLHQTPVEDLTPIAGLRQLELLDANGTRVTRLPGRHLPRLRKLWLLSAPIEAGHVGRFARKNPRCRIAHGWAAWLRAAVGHATGLRVRRGGVGQRARAGDPVFRADQREINNLVQAIDIHEDRSGGHCYCLGDQTLEFYHHQQLIAVVSVHHGDHLRWEGWPGDARLTAASARWLTEWLAKRGFSTSKRSLK